MMAIILSILSILGIIITIWYGIKIYRYPKSSALMAIQIAGWMKGMNRDAIKLAIAMARIESANFSSPLYEQGKNMFGMSENSRIKDNITIDGKSFSKYKSLIESAKDFFTNMINNYSWSKKMSYTELRDTLFGQNKSAFYYMGDNQVDVQNYTIALKMLDNSATDKESVMLRNFIFMILVPTIAITIVAVLLGAPTLIKNMLSKKKKVDG